MALIDSKQLNPRFTGSFTVSGSFVGDSESTSSFARIVGTEGIFSDVAVTDDLTVTDDVDIGGVLTATGGTTLGNADTDTHTIIGHITASGNISSSGEISGSGIFSDGPITLLSSSPSTPNAKILINSSNNNLNIGDTIVVNDGNNRVGMGDSAPSSPDTELHIKSDTPVVTLQRTNNNQKGAIDFQGQGGTVGASIEFVADTNDISIQTFDGSGMHEKMRIQDGADGNIKVSGSTEITGSLNVSSSIISSQVTASNLNVSSDATVDGDLVVTEYIKHKGDENTAIRFTDNKISLDAGGMTFFAVHDDDSAPFTATINGGSNKINFRAMDENNDVLLKTDSEAFNVGLYYAGNEKLSTQAGGINVTGHVTASGNISSSAASSASFGTYLGDGSQLTGITSVTTSSIQNLGIGIISGSEQLPSGIISGSTHVFTAVTSSGDISGSGTGSFGILNVGGGIFTSASLAAGGSGVSSYTDLTNVPSGIISGSGQLPSGLVSGSSQIISVSDNAPSNPAEGDLWWKSNDGNLYVYYDGYWVISIDTTTVLPDGVISGSSQLPSGTVSGSDQITYDGNRRVLNTDLGDLFDNNFNPGTSGSVIDFLNAVFYPNTPPSISGSEFDLNEFEVSGSTVGTITATDAEALSTEISFAAQSGYSDNFFKIHSGSGVISLNTMSTASMNTTERPSDSAQAHPFLVQVSDNITTSQATIFIRVIPNTAPKFRTSSVGGTVINANTGSVNENTTNGTTVLTMFVTDDESDSITLSPLSQSANNHFSSSFSDISGGKQLLIKTNTGSFDFESITSYNLAISASDQHFGSTESSSAYITTLPILINVTNNQAPTMASQVFTMNERSGSFPDIGLGSSTNSVTTVGTVTTNDNEGDTVTFTTLTLASGSGGGNTGQSDPSNNPFQITSAGVLQLKAGQFLNADTFDSYQYQATYKDNFNDASSSGVITINITDDVTPSITTNVSGNSFHIIESALSGSSIRVNSNGRTGTVADVNSNQSVLFAITPSGSLPSKTKDTGSLGISSTGNLSVGFDVSSSLYNFDDGNVISGSVTVTNAFGTSNSANIAVSMSINNAPTPSFSNTSANLNTNGARPSNTLTTISFSDTESDSLEHDTFVFTDPSGQLNALKDGNNYLIRATTNLSGSTDYEMTASIKDEHGFRTGTEKHDITIAMAPVGTLTTNGSFFIIESALSGSNIVTNSNGRTGTQADVGATYSPQYNSAAAQYFEVNEADKTTPHQFITSSNAGGLSIKSNISGSGRVSGQTLTGSVEFQDQFGNIGSGSISVSIVTNNAPSISFTPSSVTLAAENAISGSFVTSASFSDTESDSMEFDTFSLTGTHSDLFSSHRVGNSVLIRTNTDLSASSYSFSAHINDEHGFNAATSSLSITVTPMIYFYKNTNVLVLDGSESTAITQLGDSGGDDAGITSGSFMGHLKIGKIGDSTITNTDGKQMLLIASQSVNHLASSGSGHSTIRQFGNINLSGNSDNGHQFILLYPSSSQVFQKPASLRAGLGGSTAKEFTVFNDNASSDQAVTAGLHYFSTDAGVKVFGNDRWGMIFALDASTNPTQYYHLLSSSGSAPSSEV